VTAHTATDVLAVEVANLSRRYDTVTALDNVSLGVRRGEFFSLLGPSGCGKTTLLRIIGGFDQATEGEVRIHGKDVLDEPPYVRRTNMIFQHLALFPHMSVFENVSFGLEMKGVPAGERKKRVEQMLALVRLEGLGGRAVDQLSGGQRQRVAMARALVNEPDVLLLDEPLGALDLQLRLRMQEELRRLQKSLGSTFIFVTHDQGEAITMSDRIAVMSQGRVIQVGTPAEVYESPTHRFVAEFMGHANLIAGTIAATDGRFGALDAAPGRLEGRIVGNLSVGTPGLLAVRYEKVDVAPAGSAAQGLRARVSEIRYMGPTVRVDVKLAGDLMIHADLPGARTGGMSVGDDVVVSWPRESAVLLEG
jgi:spermidine/putrescine transport system ATP-binding protein